MGVFSGKITYFRKKKNGLDIFWGFEKKGA
jgi:hypothetical protein